MEKLRHGNQQRRKRGMATTKQRDRRTQTEAIERKAITAKNKAPLNTQSRKQGQKGRKQDGHSKEKVGYVGDMWTI